METMNGIIIVFIFGLYFIFLGINRKYSEENKKIDEKLDLILKELKGK